MTVVDRVRKYATERPADLALAFAAPLQPAVDLSWKQLSDSIDQLAAYFAAQGVSAGEINAVLSDSPREQILGFLGSIACGAVPTILSHPSIKQDAHRFFRTFAHTLKNSGARTLLCSSSLAANVQPWLSQADLHVRVIELPDLTHLPDAAPPLVAQPDPVMFLQFSSGTTGLRKGVAVKHATLHAQAEAYAESLGFTRADRVVNWLPLYHDLGLVAACLMPLHHGAASVHLSPFAWLQSPLSVFLAAMQYRASFAWFPNFALNLCATRITDEDVQRLDLRSMRAIISVGEPVRAQSLDAFHQRFAPAGISRERVIAGYGMAENVMAVTQRKVGQVQRTDQVRQDALHKQQRAIPADTGGQASTFVSCGQPIRGTSVRIAGSPADRTVGEIEIKGECLFEGYWRGQALAPDSWFATGDLGYLADGELFVTGRSKDLIIHRGSNLYPGDIEERIESVRGCKAGRVVVFGVFDERDGTENIVAMAEVDDGVDQNALKAAIREEVTARFGVALHDVSLCEPGVLLKSTSGKLSRDQNRALYHERSILARARSAVGQEESSVHARDLVEVKLLEIWRAALRLPSIGLHQRLFADLGADSVIAMKALGEIRRELQLDLAPAALLEHDTIEKQAILVRGMGSRVSSPLVTLRVGHSSRELLFVHPVTGDALAYLPLVKHLPEDWTVRVFQNRYLYLSTGMYEGFQELAADHVTTLLNHRPHGPYVLAGYSAGGAIALEMARQLSAMGKEVATVILLDTLAPLSPAQRLWEALKIRMLRSVFRAMIHYPQAASWVPGNGRARSFLHSLPPEVRLLAIVTFFTEIKDILPAVRYCFPDRFPTAPSSPGRTADVSWEAVYPSLKEFMPPWLWGPRVPGNTPGLALRRALVTAKTLALSKQYSPGGLHRGQVTMIRARGSHKSLGWDRYISSPMEVIEVDVTALAGSDAHRSLIFGENAPTIAKIVEQVVQRFAGTRSVH